MATCHVIGTGQMRTIRRPRPNIRVYVNRDANSIMPISCRASVDARSARTDNASKLRECEGPTQNINSHDMAAGHL